MMWRVEVLLFLARFAEALEVTAWAAFTWLWCESLIAERMDVRVAGPLMLVAMVVAPLAGGFRRGCDRDPWVDLMRVLRPGQDVPNLGRVVSTTVECDGRIVCKVEVPARTAWAKILHTFRLKPDAIERGRAALREGKVTGVSMGFTVQGRLPGPGDEWGPGERFAPDAVMDYSALHGPIVKGDGKGGLVVLKPAPDDEPLG